MLPTDLFCESDWKYQNLPNNIIISLNHSLEPDQSDSMLHSFAKDLIFFYSISYKIGCHLLNSKLVQKAKFE